jgi:hypothetical protein
MEGMTTRGSNRNAFGNLQNVNGELVLRKKARQPVRENERKRETPRDEANREIETGEKWHQLPVLKNPFQVPLDDKRLHLQKHIEHIDDEKDPNEVPEYAFTAFEYFRAREQAQPITDYINDQGEINEKMRQVLVDWLVEMQESFQLAHETLYLAVVMTDLYMSKKTIKRDEMQLIGATSILLASKFYERYPPYLDDLVFVCDEAYSRDQFLKMEIKLIKELEFDINLPVSYLFLRRYAKIMKFTMPQLTLARYILELSLMEYQFCTESASKMASAAFLWSLKHFGEDWNDALVFHTTYEKSELIPIVEQLSACVVRAPRKKLRTIFDKYSHENFFQVTDGLKAVEINDDAMDMSSNI